MKKTILVVEDEKLSRKLIVGTLINHGFECLTAENGQYALDILENNHCDLILTDLKMPIMDGIEFIGAYRKRETEGGHKDNADSNAAKNIASKYIYWREIGPKVAGKKMPDKYRFDSWMKERRRLVV
jgi:CheY-like chemotaxis protein